MHFDGPHMTRDVLTGEAVWFANRAGTNCRFVFDDYPKYNMPLIQSALEPFGFKKLEAGKNKICLEKELIKNPEAFNVRTRRYRSKVIQSKKVYNRSRNDKIMSER